MHLQQSIYFIRDFMRTCYRVPCFELQDELNMDAFYNWFRSKHRFPPAFSPAMLPNGEEIEK